MQQRSTAYVLVFSAIICVVCSLLVSSTAVGLRDRQELNAKLDRQKNVLQAAGLVDPTKPIAPQEILDLFAEQIEPVLVDLRTGEYIEDPSIDLGEYAAEDMRKDPATSYEAPENDAAVRRIANKVMIYNVMEGGQVKMLVLPVRGMGLWSTLYGFIGVEADGQTVAGITFYQHGETPGLGGEIDNPRWKGLWPGKKIFGPDGDVALEVVKPGKVRKPEHEIDGISGATLTGRGVSALVEFWLGENGYGPLLKRMRGEA